MRAGMHNQDPAVARVAARDAPTEGSLVKALHGPGRVAGAVALRAPGGQVPWLAGLPPEPRGRRQQEIRPKRRRQDLAAEVTMGRPEDPSVSDP